MKIFFVYCFIILLSFVCFSSCKQEFDINELQDYVNNPKNGLSITEQQSQFTINATYRPSILYAYNELGTTEIKIEKKDSIFKKYENFIYIVLSYSIKGFSINKYFNHEALAEIVNILSFEMLNRVKLIANTKEIPLLYSNYIQLYGASSSNQVLLVFEKPKQWQNIKVLNLSVEDIGLGLYTAEFKFKIEDINKIPLKIIPNK